MKARAKGVSYQDVLVIAINVLGNNTKCPVLEVSKQFYSTIPYHSNVPDDSDADFYAWVNEQPFEEGEEFW